MKFVVTALLLGAVAVAQAADIGASRQIIRYHGIRLCDPEGALGLRNPERGFRNETRIAESNDAAWAAKAGAELSGRLTLAQCYCYLPEFEGTAISPQKLAQLQASFDMLRRQGMKAVLRFAYESKVGGSSGPTLTDIRRHIVQLRPLLVKNVGAIEVLQAGMIGLWGEWHHSVHGLDRDVAAQKVIVGDLLDALPRSRMIQLRRASFERAIFGSDAIVTAATAHDGSPISRVGFHNDYFVVRQNSWDTSPGTRDFQQLCEESPYVMVDGEMPWANEATDIDAMGALLRFRIHHYTSFSLAHNFREGGREGALMKWQKTPLTAEEARVTHLPMDDGYFENGRGRPISRNVFDYVRDHLGYRIELQKADLPHLMKAGDPFHVEITLINRGFSALQNPRRVLFVLIAGDGSAIQLPTSADPEKWQPCQPGDALFQPLIHEVSFSTRAAIAGLRPGEYQLGLWLPDSDPVLCSDSRYAIRCANRDVAWRTDIQAARGVNVLGTIAVNR